MTAEETRGFRSSSVGEAFRPDAFYPNVSKSIAAEAASYNKAGLDAVPQRIDKHRPEKGRSG